MGLCKLRPVIQLIRFAEIQLECILINVGDHRETNTYLLLIGIVLLW